jgi:phosphoserine phosphatase RsbU/P
MRSLFHSTVSSAPPTVAAVDAPFPRIVGAEIAADFLGTRVGGDLYDSLRVSPERILFGLLDVAGRREANLDIIAAAQQTFRNFGTELFSLSDINESEAMTELSLRINRVLIEASHGVHSCPAFIGCYHETLGTLCYANAGHTPGLLRDGGGITALSSTGLPLGLFSHAPADAPTIGLEKGAALLLVSRGVIECEGRTDDCTEEFGLERVKQVFRSAPPSGAEALCAFVLSSVTRFEGKSRSHDDRTALALVRTT